MQRETDKIVIDASSEDEASIDELLSRLEPGETVTGAFTASLDEYQNKIAVLSIDTINVKSDAVEAEAGEESDDSGEAGDEKAKKAAAVTLFKGKRNAGKKEEASAEA